MRARLENHAFFAKGYGVKIDFQSSRLEFQSSRLDFDDFNFDFQVSRLEE
jgi:hypothetical protein